MANAQPRLIPLRTIADARGAITVGDLPFAAHRFFTFQPTLSETMRGGHAHRTLEQVVLCLNGVVVAITERAGVRAQHRMVNVSSALHVPALTWLELYLNRGARVLVLASAPYDEADYIRSKAEFMETV